jgi:hypothetical protein
MFQAGQPATALPDRPWTMNVKKTTSAGLLWARVRVVSVPLTRYSQFGLWACQKNIEAGDDIRYVARSDAEQLDLPRHDYWLFDSHKLALMHYNDDDQFLGFELVDDPAMIVQHNYWRDVARHYASRRDDFAAKHEQRSNNERRPSA